MAGEQGPIDIRFNIEIGYLPIPASPEGAVVLEQLADGQAALALHLGPG